MKKQKTIDEILRDLSCPECEAFQGTTQYEGCIEQAKAEIRELVESLRKSYGTYEGGAIYNQAIDDVHNNLK